MSEKGVTVEQIEEAKQALGEAFVKVSDLWTNSPDEPESDLFNRSRDMVIQAKRLLETYATMNRTKCDHDWVDAKNEVVQSGEMCSKCRAIRCSDGSILRAV